MGDEESIERGIHMIQMMQATEGHSMTREQARAEWLAMTPGEQRTAVFVYNLFRLDETSLEELLSE